MTLDEDTRRVSSDRSGGSFRFLPAAGRDEALRVALPRAVSRHPDRVPGGAGRAGANVRAGEVLARAASPESDCERGGYLDGEDRSEFAAGFASVGERSTRRWYPAAR